MISDEQPIFEPYKNILSYVCCKNLLLRYLFTAMLSLQKDKRSWRITQYFFMFFIAHQGLGFLLYYLYSITV